MSVAATAVFALPSFAQHPVLYETFTNSFDLCPSPNTFDQTFKSTLTSKGSKVIHLNHHIVNFGDPMVKSISGSDATDSRLSNTTGTTNEPVFVSAVDRQVFSSTGTRVTPSQTEWEDQIDADANQPPVASITLTSATIDKSVSNFNVLHADLDITSLQAIQDTLKIRYAVLQDNYSYAQCSGTGPSVHNDVVRYITVGDSIVFLPGASSGQTQHVQFIQKITASDPQYKIADMKLVVFLEDARGGSYHVVNAAMVKKDFDTLQSPPRSLALVDASIDGQVYHPGDIAVIPFKTTNIPVVTASYSLDNGTTWHIFSEAAISPINWTVPDSGTTQGKFKITDDDGTNIAIEKGNFTILQAAHTLKILHPTAADNVTVNRQTSIVWTKMGIDTVRIDYSINGGQTWTTLESKYTGDTVYKWLVPGPATSQAQVELYAVGQSDVLPTTSETFVIHDLEAVGESKANTFAINGIYPNPVNQGAEPVLSLTVPGIAPVTLQILDVLGREVFTETSYISGSSIWKLPTEHLAAGNYIVRLTNGPESLSRVIEVR